MNRRAGPGRRAALALAVAVAVAVAVAGPATARPALVADAW